MDRKGEITVGVIIIAFIGVLVGVILLDASSVEIGKTNTLSTVNTSTGSDSLAPAENSTTDLVGKVVTNFLAQNASNGAVIPAANYTILNNQLNSAGQLTSQLQIGTGYGTDSPALQNGTAVWNVSYTSEPNTYISDGGGRAIAGIILIFMALAIAVVALFPTLKSGLESFGR